MLTAIASATPTVYAHRRAAARRRRHRGTTLPIDREHGEGASFAAWPRTAWTRYDRDLSPSFCRWRSFAHISRLAGEITRATSGVRFVTLHDAY
jgi:hypothetical protein